MQSRFHHLGLASLVAGCLMTLPVHARSSGITGYSGKNGSTCTACHSSNTRPKPTVTLSGPTQLLPGDTGSYTFTITGGPGASGGMGGMNVAVDKTSAQLQAGTGLYLENEELTHVGGNAFTGDSITFNFTLVAPSEEGTVKMFAAGNSTDNNGNSTNDQSATTTLDILITNNPQADAGTGNTSDAGTVNTSDAGTGNTSDAGMGNMPDAGTSNGGDTDSGGCAAIGGPPMAWLLVMIAARARRRTRIQSR